jgi:hypothetical protein
MISRVPKMASGSLRECGKHVDKHCRTGRIHRCNGEHGSWHGWLPFVPEARGLRVERKLMAES